MPNFNQVDMYIAQLLGGMGNQMFQYALARSLSVKHQFPFALDVDFLLNRVPMKDFVFRNYDLDIFKLTQDQFLGFSSFGYPEDKAIKSIPHRLVHLSKVILQGYTYKREFDFRFNPKALEWKSKTYLDGNWQSYKYFESISSLIKSDFEFVSPMQDTSLELLHRISNAHSICVNVRRTDFLVGNFHGVVGTEYITKGVDIVAQGIQNPEVFIFSDDIAWCENNIKLPYPITFVGHNHAGKKFRDYLQLMQHCKYFVIPNSSFAWWAAWLCDFPEKRVVAPKKWFNDPKVDTSDLIPENWLRI